MIAWRICQSSVRYCLYSRSENQRLFQSVLTPRRKPYGLIFWPMGQSSSFCAPGWEKPAASAFSAVSNQTSALVTL